MVAVRGVHLACIWPLLIIERALKRGEHLSVAEEAGMNRLRPWVVTANNLRYDFAVILTMMQARFTTLCLAVTTGPVRAAPMTIWKRWDPGGLRHV